MSPFLCSVTEDDDEDERRKRRSDASLGARMASRKMDMEKEERRRKNMAWRECRGESKVEFGNFHKNKTKKNVLFLKASLFSCFSSIFREKKIALNLLHNCLLLTMSVYVLVAESSRMLSSFTVC